MQCSTCFARLVKKVIVLILFLRVGELLIMKLFKLFNVQSQRPMDADAATHDTRILEMISHPEEHHHFEMFACHA